MVMGSAGDNWKNYEHMGKRDKQEIPASTYHSANLKLLICLKKIIK